MAGKRTKAMVHLCIKPLSDKRGVPYIIVHRLPLVKIYINTRSLVKLVKVCKTKRLSRSKSKSLTKEKEAIAVTFGTHTKLPIADCLYPSFQLKNMRLSCNIKVKELQMRCRLATLQHSRSIEVSAPVENVSK